MQITPKPLQIEVYCRDCGTYLEATWEKTDRGIAVEPCKCPLNEIRQIYEKYKHMDKVVCDVRFNDFPHVMVREMWQAIKASVEPPEPLPDALPTEASTHKDCFVP